MAIQSSTGNILLHVTLAIYNLMCYCLVNTFSDHEGNTSKTTMTRKVIKILDKLLPLTGRQAGPLQSKILRTPLVKTTKVSSRLMSICSSLFLYVLLCTCILYFFFTFVLRRMA